MAIKIKETRTTPYVSIDQGQITIVGRSIPEDSFEFFEPLMEACQSYIQKPAKQTRISIHLEYVNSGSKKYLTNMLTVLEQSYLEGNGYEIEWTYDSDDEAMMDLGNDLKSIIKIPISIKASE